MNKLILIAFAFAFSTANVAQARVTVCGKLSTVNVFPKCEPGQLCSHLIRVVEVLTQANGLQLELQTKSSTVLRKMSAFKGYAVCVAGNPINDGQFEVTSIRSTQLP